MRNQGNERNIYNEFVVISLIHTDMITKQFLLFQIIVLVKVFDKRTFNDIK